MSMKLNLGPVSRISMGLVSLAAFLLLTADLLLGLMPDQSDIARQVRKRATDSSPPWCSTISPKFCGARFTG
jgi:hypothetical protein